MEGMLLQEEYGICGGKEKEKSPVSFELRTEKFGTGADLCLNFLRQLTIIYHFIHYRLDRPFLEDKYWPDYLEGLKQELVGSLRRGGVPEGWLESLFLLGGADREKIRMQSYDFSRSPFFTAAKDQVAKTLERVNQIKRQAGGIDEQKDRDLFIKSELRKVRNWALQKAWEVAEILGVENL